MAVSEIRAACSVQAIEDPLAPTPGRLAGIKGR